MRKMTGLQGGRSGGRQAAPSGSERNYGPDCKAAGRGALQGGASPESAQKDTTCKAGGAGDCKADASGICAKDGAACKASRPRLIGVYAKKSNCKAVDWFRRGGE